MAPARAEDEALRVRALEQLGPLGDDLARAALEAGAVLVERDVLSWEGSHGTMHGHRVIVALPAELRAQVDARHAAKDSLAAALAAAMAERGSHSVADVRLEVGDGATAPSDPYRDPRAGRS
jgi:hypothetical protein